MNKYLYVEFINFWVTESSLENTGVALPEVRRIVKIPLTPEQTEMLNPRKVGTAGFQDKYEFIRLIGVQDE